MEPSRISNWPILAMTKYKGSLPYIKYLELELKLRNVDLNSVECGRLFILAQGEAEREKFFSTFQEVDLTFEEIRQYIEGRTERSLSSCEKLIGFANKKKSPNESYETYSNELKQSLKGTLPDSALDYVVLVKMLPLADEKILENLLGEDELSLEKFLEKAKYVEQQVRLSKLLKAGSVKNQMLVQNESKCDDSVNFKNNYKDMVCLLCKNKGHLANRCPTKIAVKTNNEKVNEEFKGLSLNINSLTVESHELFPREWVKSPLVYAPIEYGSILVSRVLLDSGAQGNTFPSERMSEFIEAGFQIIPVDNGFISGVGGSKVIDGYINVELLSISTRKKIPSKVFFAHGAPISLDTQTCLALDLSAEEAAKEIIQERETMVRALDRIYIDHPDLVGTFLEFKETFDDSVVLPKITVDLKISSSVPNKIFRPYSTSYEQKRILSQHLAKELLLGRIYRINSPQVALPITIEPNQKRVVTDSKWLNKFIKDEPLLLPDRSSISSMVGGSEAFTVFDYKSAFKLCNIPDHLNFLNTISTEYGYFASSRLQYGIRSASALFHTAVGNIISHLDKCIHYVDDILFYGSISEQKQSICKFVQICSKYSLKFNISKIQLLSKQVKFLGSILDIEHGWMMDPSRAVMLQNLERPKTKNEALSFVGRFIYVSKNIPDYTNKIQHILPRSKESQYVWDRVREESYKSLVSNLQEYQNLALPNQGEMLQLFFFPNNQYIHVEIRGAHDQLIDIVTRVLTAPEKNYSDTERELLGVNESFLKSRPYFLSHKIVWVTRSKLIAKLMTEPLESVLDSSLRIQRLLSPILMWGIQCIYSADFKKLIDKRQHFVMESNNFELKLSTSGDTKYLRNKEIYSDQSCNSECETLLKYLTAGKEKERLMLSLPSWLRERAELVGIENGLLCIEGKVLLSKKLMKLVIQELHSLYHGGKQAMLNEVTKYYTGFGWTTVISDVLDSCNVCLLTKSSSHRKLAKWEPATRPRQRAHYNLAYIPDENNKKQMVIVFVDVFSCYLSSNQLFSKNVADLKLFFQPILDQCSFEVVVCDNEPALVQPELTAFFAQYNTYHTTSVPYAPSSNGVVERYIGILKKAVARLILEKPCLKFEDRLKQLLHHMNNTANSKHQATPSQLFFTAFNGHRSFTPPVKIELPKQRIYFKPQGKLSTLYEEGWLTGRVGDRINIIEKDDYLYHVSPDFCHQGFLPNSLKMYTSDSILDDAMHLVDDSSPTLVEPDENKNVVDVPELGSEVSDVTLSPSITEPVNSTRIYRGESAVCHVTPRRYKDIDDLTNLLETTDLSICNNSLIHEMNEEKTTLKEPVKTEIRNQEEWEKFMKDNDYGNMYVFVDGSEFQGRGCAMFMRFNDQEVILGGTNLHGNTTNNAAELMGLIFALRSVGKANYPLCFFSDSAYVTNSINNGWLERETNSSGKPRSHADKFKEISELWRPHFKLVKVSAHVGILGNEIVDKLAKLYSRKLLENGYVRKKFNTDKEVIEFLNDYECQESRGDVVDRVDS